MHLGLIDASFPITMWSVGMGEKPRVGEPIARCSVREIGGSTWRHVSRVRPPPPPPSEVIFLLPGESGVCLIRGSLERKSGLGNDDGCYLDYSVGSAESNRISHRYCLPPSVLDYC